MRLPNGYGTVYKLSGTRRNPWIARITKEIKYDEQSKKGRQIFETLGYYPDKKAALLALAKYNDNPYDICAKGKSFSEVYTIWSEDYFKTLTNKASVRTVVCAYNYCEPLFKMAMSDIRVMHLEHVIENADVGNATKLRIKSLFNMMYRFALRHEFVDKNYAEMCNSVKREPAKRKNIIFSQEEISLLWDNIEIPFVDMILIGIYSGWRPQELSILKICDIDLEGNKMLGGLKTAAGKNRFVPMHPLIKPLIEKRYSIENEYLFNDDECTQGAGRQLTYDKYRHRFDKVMNRLKMKHHPHETRHTFITKAKNANMDDNIIKLIVGHSIVDITEKVYTHRVIEQLFEEIQKIKE